MLPPGTQLWKSSSGGGRDGLGLSCTEGGLFLGRTALVERDGEGYVVRARADLERLLARAYGAGVAVDRVMPGFRAVAAALGERNLCLAQIAALQLRLPDLPDNIVRGGLEAEDRLIKSARSSDRLARNGWDPDEHPRAGVPPNPGWFAPAYGGEAPQRVEAAAIKRVTDKVMPGGVPIGRPGRGLDVRELPGDLKAAADLFNYLRVGGTSTRSNPNLTV